MGRIMRETVIVSVGCKTELVTRIDARLMTDPRFVSRSEYAVFCIQQEYGLFMKEFYEGMRRCYAE